MLLKTNVVSFQQEAPVGVKRLAVFGRKLYSVHTNNSVIRWDIEFAFTQELYIPPFSDELSCILCVPTGVEKVQQKRSRGKQHLVLLGSGSGQIYSCNFPLRSLTKVEQTFSGAVIDMKLCGSSLCAVVSQNKLIRLYSIESSAQSSGPSSTSPGTGNVTFLLLTTISASKQSSEAIFALSALGNELVAGSVNVVVHITWKDVNTLLSQVDQLNSGSSGQSNYSVEFLQVPKDQKVKKKSGGRQSKLSVGKHEDVSIRSIVLIDESTCVTGDNLGRTMWWDLNSGTVMQTIKSHLAAITTLVYDETSNRVYASGVDPYVIAFSKIEGQDEWIQSVTLKKIPCEVTSAVLLKNLKDKPDFILIGQKSPIMYLWKAHSESATDILAFPKHFNCVSLDDGKLIVPKSNEFCVCCIESANGEPDVSGFGKTDVEMEGSEKLDESQGSVKSNASLKEVFGVKLPDFHALCNVAMSNDTKWLCYSSQKSSKFFLRLFQINEDFSLTQVPLKGRFFVPIVAVNFSYSSDSLIIVFSDGTFQRYNLVSGGEPFSTKIQLNVEAEINLLQVHFHRKTEFMAVITADRNVAIISLKDLQILHELPKRKAFPVSSCFSSASDSQSKDASCLSVLYSDYRVFEFNMSQSSFSKWCSYGDNDFEQCEKFYPSIGSSLQYVAHDNKLCKLLFHTYKSLHSLDWNSKLKTVKDQDQVTPRKRSMKRVEKSQAELTLIWLKSVTGFSYVRNMNVINDNELVLFLFTQQQLLNCCDSVFNRKTFAT